MTHLDNGIVVTDIDAGHDHAVLSGQGYTIRHIETWRRDFDIICVIWDPPSQQHLFTPF